jgi:tetratricopeptide (TPR) repeat protein
MKSWIYIALPAVLLVALGIWLVWPQEQKIEVPPEAELEEVDVLVQPEPPPVAAPARRTAVESSAPRTAEPPRAPDRTEILRVMEEAADNRQALKDWDRQLLLKCRKLIRERKFEEAHQCIQLRQARNPEEPAIYLERGILHAHMGKLTEAYWDYTKFLELAPDSPDAPRIRAILDKMEASSEEREEREERGQDRL